jgi:hypothetical protein
MLASNNKRLVFGSIVASAVSTVMGFQPISVLSQAASRSSSLRMVAVDPSTVTKKEYEDICGVSFGAEGLESRLARTSYLYPKHVEVIEDIAPIAAQMVDEVVSLSLCLPLGLSYIRDRGVLGVTGKVWETFFVPHQHLSLLIDKVSMSYCPRPVHERQLTFSTFLSFSKAP